MITLRPYEKNDAGIIVSWIGDEISFRKWCADRYDSYPLSAGDINRNYEECCKNGDFFPLTALDGSSVFGHLIMRYTDEKKSVVRFGFIIIDNKKRGRGYGKKMLEKAAEYAFEKLGAEKITLGVFDNNQSAYRCYRAAGFAESETEDDVIFHISGQAWKCIELEMLKKTE